jgi:hypothetical protein
MDCCSSQAKSVQKAGAIDSRIAGGIKDSSKSSLDQSLEGVKKGQELMQRHTELEAQVMNNTANR